MLLVALMAIQPANTAEPPRRIVSLNLCADQFLLSFVGEERIAALSPNAGDPAMSHHWERARRLPAISGSAEEVLALEPDLVLAGPFAGAEAKTFLRSAGVRVVELPVPETLDDVAHEIRAFGALVGEAQRAQNEAERFEVEVRRIAAAAHRERPLGLYVQRRGIVTGHGTLIDDVMRSAGLDNVIESFGFAQLDLEHLVTLSPDLIVLDGMPSDADQGAAMLLHPALAERFAEVPRVVLSVPLLVCPGPWTVDALRAVSEAVVPTH